MSIWIMVADASRARLLSAEIGSAPLVEVEDFIHSASRLREQALLADRPTGEYGQHTMGHEKAAGTQEARVFARELCDKVEKAANTGQFRRIYLIAPPKFLGMLRAAMGKTSAGLVAGEIHKDLVRHNLEDIRSHLPKKL